MNPLIRIGCVLIGAFAICECVFIPINKGFVAYNINSTTHYTEIFEGKTYYDLLFIGSSRTHKSIYPGAIDSICHVNSYNAGSDGAKIKEFKMFLDGYLIHHPAPRTVVLTLDMVTFLKPYEIHNYPYFYPYLNNPAVSQTLSENGYHVLLIKALPFVRMTDYDDYTRELVIRKLLKKEKDDLPEGDFVYKGYISNGEEYIRAPDNRAKKKKVCVSGETIAPLMAIIDTCKARNIKLIFSYAPEYDFSIQRNSDHPDSVLGFITQTAIKSKIPLLRDDSLDICKNPKLFADISHLNKVGALVYSPILAKEINICLAEQPDTVH